MKENAAILRDLQRWVKRAADEFKDSVIASIGRAWLYSGPPDETPLVWDLDHITSSLTDELTKRRNIFMQAAKFYLSASTKKPDEWGPSTLKAVAAIVRKAEKAFGDEGPISSAGRSAKPHQRAAYYAGLLCMETGLLRPKNPNSQILIADQVRKRQDRGEPLRMADEHYRNYPEPEMVAGWIASARRKHRFNPSV